MLDLQYTLESYLDLDIVEEGFKDSIKSAGRSIFDKIQKAILLLKKQVLKLLNFIKTKYRAVRDKIESKISDEETIKCRNSVRYVKEVERVTVSFLASMSKVKLSENAENNGLKMENIYNKLIYSINYLDSLKDKCKPKENKYDPKTATQLTNILLTAINTLNETLAKLTDKGTDMSTLSGVSNKLFPILIGHCNTALSFIQDGIASN